MRSDSKGIGVNSTLVRALMTVLSLPLFGMLVVMLTARARTARHRFPRWAFVVLGATAPLLYSAAFAWTSNEEGYLGLPGAWWQGLMFTLLAVCAYFLFKGIDSKLRSKRPIVAFVASVLPFGLIPILNHQTEVFSPDGALGIMTGIVWVAAFQGFRRTREPDVQQPT